MKAWEIIRRFESWAPTELVDSWDRTGLQIGDPDQIIEGIVVALDVTEEVVDKAIENSCDMIISHHPFLFSPLDNLIMDNYRGALIKKIIKNDIVIYNAHTNLDVASGGINDELARLFEMNNTRLLRESARSELVKLVVYVPQTHQQDILEAFSEAEAGHLGNYSDCSFSAEGTGRFRPEEGSDPFLGSRGELESVPEAKMETIVEKNNLERTLRTVKDRHPYEEIAFDIYPLLNKAKVFGYGRVGDVEECTLQELAEYSKAIFGLQDIRVYGNIEGNITRIAVCGGGGSDFIGDAARENAQVYITGDIKYHDVQYAFEQGMALIDGTHYGTEKIILPLIKEKLDEYTEGNLKIIVHEDRSFHHRAY